MMGITDHYFCRKGKLNISYGCIVCFQLSRKDVPLVFTSYWAIDFTVRRNPGLVVKEIVVNEG